MKLAGILPEAPVKTTSAPLEAVSSGTMATKTGRPVVVSERESPVTSKKDVFDEENDVEPLVCWPTEACMGLVIP